MTDKNTHAGGVTSRRRSLADLISGFCLFVVMLALSHGAHAIDLDREITFNIPPQDLDAALLQFSQQARIQVIISGDLRGQATKGITGKYEIKQELNELIEPAGLRFRVAGDDVITVTKPGDDKSTRLLSSPSDASPGLLLASQTTAPGEASGRVTGKNDAEAIEGADNDHPVNDKDEPLSEVVVTGSHIRGVAPVGTPIIQITRTDIDNSGYTSTSQLIESLPQNFGAGAPQVVGIQGSYQQEFSAFNSTFTPSLRGLGDATLTLLNGHRISRTGGANGSDISSIPLAAIERVEVLPDGASAIYGTDAVAGVINVVLRKDYDGIEAGSSYTEPTRSGGGQQQTYSLLGGTHWQGGSVLMSYTSQNQDPLFTKDRSFSSAAADPTTLYPSSHSNAVTLYVNQAMSERASFYIDALYNSATNNHYASYSSPEFSYVDYAPGNSRVSVLNAGIDSHIGDTWLIGLDTNYSQDKRSQTLGEVADGSNGILSISQPTGREYGAEVHGDGTVVSLAPGDLKAALGGGARRETFELFLELPHGTRLSGQRADSYAYAEFQMPLVPKQEARPGMESLVLSASGRYDHYSDFGSTFNPKFGISYGVLRDVRLSGSYGRSFRAPLLQDLVTPVQGFIFPAIDARFPGGNGVGLEIAGGDPALRPETSRAWTATVEYTPARISGLSLSSSYFSYNFANKILAPINADVFSVPLSDPSIQPFTTFFPSSAQVQHTINKLSLFYNYLGPTVGPNDVQAIVNDLYQNVSSWTARGVDLLGSYHLQLERGMLDFNVNATTLTVKEEPNAGAAPQTLSGAVFGPSKWRARGGVVWSVHQWTVGAFVNYSSKETDIYALPKTQVDAFITADARISYTVPRSPAGWLSGLRVSLAALNVLDRNPPSLSYGSTGYPGLGYDPTNASPFGRLLTLQLDKQWGGK